MPTLTEKITEKLNTMAVDADRKISGVIVSRAVDGWRVNDQLYSLEDAAELLVGFGSASSGIDYKRTGFVLMTRPDDGRPSKVVSHKVVSDRSAHVDLLRDARRKKLHVYYGSIVQREGRRFLTYPLTIDWDSVDEAQDDRPTETNNLNCPYCNKQLHSTPGRTLHVKNKHPDQYEQYVASYVKS